MINRKFYYLILCLLSVLIFFVFTKTKSDLIDVKGRAELLESSNPLIELNGFSSIPIIEAKILAINGKVKAETGKFSLPINSFKSNKLITYTDSKGIFKFSLKPGIYTFFIVQEDNAYLNSFDGKGFYKSNKVASEIDNLVITVTTNSFF